MSALPLTSARFSKLQIPFQNHPLDGDLRKSFLEVHIVPFFLFLIIIWSYTLILFTSQQLMTSQIMSHIEYLTQTYNILILILYSQFMRNVAALALFNTI